MIYHVRTEMRQSLVSSAEKAGLSPRKIRKQVQIIPDVLNAMAYTILWPLSCVWSEASNKSPEVSEMAWLALLSTDDAMSIRELEHICEWLWCLWLSEFRHPSCRILSVVDVPVSIR